MHASSHQIHRSIQPIKSQQVFDQIPSLTCNLANENLNAYEHNNTKLYTYNLQELTIFEFSHLFFFLILIEIKIRLLNVYSVPYAHLLRKETTEA